MKVKLTLTEDTILAEFDNRKDVITLEETLRVTNKSPTGFNWGYGGSGPAQAALGCCMLLYGDQGKSTKVYQPFKRRFIAGLANSDTVADYRSAELVLDPIPAIEGVLNAWLFRVDSRLALGSGWDFSYFVCGIYRSTPFIFIVNLLPAPYLLITFLWPQLVNYYLLSVLINLVDELEGKTFGVVLSAFVSLNPDRTDRIIIKVSNLGV